MSDSCARIAAYLDDELSDVEREAFEDHLSSCESCQRALEAEMQIAAATEELAKRPDRPRVAPLVPPRRPRWRGAAAGAAMMSTVAMGVVIWLHLRPDARDQRLEAALLPRRTIVARLPYAPLDKYRPYDTPRGDVAREPIDLKLTSEFDPKSEPGALGAVLIASHDLDRAATHLGAAKGPDVEIARAALALVRHKPEEALTPVDAVLADDPKNGVAAWNRAVALGDLGLPLAAAEAFDTVAALREPGWADEAQTRANELRRVEDERRARWQIIRKTCTALENAEPPDLEVLRRGISTCRPSFYEGVRLARTRDALLALGPAADVVDEGTGAHAARELMQRAIEATPRDAAIDIYLRITRSNPPLPDAEKARLLDQLRASKNDDLVLGALPRTGGPSLRAESIRRALATNDPYYIEVGHQREAADLLIKGDALAAEALLRPLVTACMAKDLELFCQYLNFTLADVYEALHRPAKSREVVDAALARSRRLDRYWDERQLFDYRANAAELELDHSLMRAYLREATLRSNRECAQERFALESLASSSIEEIQFARARKELQTAPMCDEPPTIERLHAFADLEHVDGAASQFASIRAGFSQARADESLSAGERAQLDAFEGRLLAPHDASAATALLRRAIEAADKAQRTDVPAVKARADAFASLIAMAAAGDDGAALLSLFGEATGVQTTARCVVGALVDADRIVVVARTAEGTLLRHFDPHGRKNAAIEAGALVPATIRKALATCDRVDVLAQPPVFGLPGLLPPELAWSYRARSAPIAPHRVTDPTVFTVAAAQPPRDLELAPLNTAPGAPIEGAHHVDLRGLAATPSHALAGLPQADAIELHAHGYLDVGQSETSLIALSPDADGDFTLNASDIASAHLPKAPIVSLAACHAGYTAPYRHESWGLPEAFLLAGARAVLASREEIPDSETGAFFRSVEAAVLAGADPAVALRDARMRAIAADPKSWTGTVLLFD